MCRGKSMCLPDLQIMRNITWKKNIALIDFGAGNLYSVHKALEFIGVNSKITKDPSEIEKSDAVVFPGVGAFGAVMSSIKKNNLQEIIIKSAKSKKPFLGICVGMQVLFEMSEENPEEKGLSVFKGKVVKFKKAKKNPEEEKREALEYLKDVLLMKQKKLLCSVSFRYRLKWFPWRAV